MLYVFILQTIQHFVKNAFSNLRSKYKKVKCVCHVFRVLPCFCYILQYFDMFCYVLQDFLQFLTISCKSLLFLTNPWALNLAGAARLKGGKRVTRIGPNWRVACNPTEPVTRNPRFLAIIGCYVCRRLPKLVLPKQPVAG